MKTDNLEPCEMARIRYCQIPNSNLQPWIKELNNIFAGCTAVELKCMVDILKNLKNHFMNRK